MTRKTLTAAATLATAGVGGALVVVIVATTTVVPAIAPTAAATLPSAPPRALISAGPGALCPLVQREAIVRDAAASLSLTTPGTRYLTAEPQRLIDWTSRGMLTLSRRQGGREVTSIYDPLAGTMTMQPGVPAADAIGGVKVDAPWLAAPRLTGVAQPAFADISVRSVVRPGASTIAAFSSYRIALLDSAGGPGCELAINRAGGEGGDLPVIAAEWSSDGRYLAVLLLADAARLGPTALRIIDMNDNTWRQVDLGTRAISSATWRPGSHTLLLTAAPIGEERDTLSMLSVLADGALAHAPFGDGLTFFAPSHWGVRFSPDGERLAIACVEPDVDGVVRRGALCVWEVQPR